MYTVAQVLKPDFARSWPEAVAIVQEIASLSNPGATIPGPDDLLLDDNGALVLGFASEISEHPVIGLSRLLGHLLEGVDAPPGLRSLVADSAARDSGPASVEAFTRALAFYERPDRAGTLQAVAGRLGTNERAVNTEFVPVESAAVDSANPDTEVERLREKIAAKPEPPVEDKSAAARQPAWIKVAVVTLVAGVLAAGAFAAVHITAVRSSPPGRLLTDAGSKVVSTISNALSGLTGASEAEPLRAEEEAPPRASDASVAGTSRAVARKTAGRERPTLDRVVQPQREGRAPKTGAMPGPVGTTNAVPASTGRARPADTELPPLYSIAESATVYSATEPPKVSAPEPTRIYSAVEREVQPPRLMRPQLPKEPPPGPDTGYFSIVVNEAGTVEEVKLISPANRYPDRMLVSAAKAWRFRPALLNGQPVKYRLRIAITLQEPR